jgi:hypothetical protein
MSQLQPPPPPTGQYPLFPYPHAFPWNTTWTQHSWRFFLCTKLLRRHLEIERNVGCCWECRSTQTTLSVW